MRRTMTTLVSVVALTVPVSVAGATSPVLTVKCTETLKSADVTDGGVAGTGRCTLSGAISDGGKATDYRRATSTTALIRRVVAARKGTITFLITIHLGSGSEPWSIASGTKAYRGLRGKGSQVVDKFDATPATFVMRGSVSR
jgi:hypothetical protein